MASPISFASPQRFKGQELPGGGISGARCGSIDASLRVRGGGDVRVCVCDREGQLYGSCRVRVSMIAERRGCYRVREASRRVQQRE